MVEYISKVVTYKIIVALDIFWINFISNKFIYKNIFIIENWPLFQIKTDPHKLKITLKLLTYCINL